MEKQNKGSDPVSNEDFIARHRLSVKSIKNRFGIKSQRTQRKKEDPN